jgi:hypothetical protein
LPLLFLPCLTDAGSVFFVLQVHVSVHAVTTQCRRCHHDGTLTACDSREFAIQPRCMIVRHLPLLPAHAGGTVSYTAQPTMHASCPCSVLCTHTTSITCSTTGLVRLPGVPTWCLTSVCCFCVAGTQPRSSSAWWLKSGLGR